MSPLVPGEGSPLLFHIAFYRFVPLPDPDGCALRLRELARSLLGSVLVAAEGVNGVLAGTAAALDTFERELLGDALLGPLLAGMAFKRSACRTPPFGRLKVHRKAAIVSVGVPDLPQRGTVVSPAEWRGLLGRDDVVVLDNRNSFEFRLGRFRQAVDPQVSHFRDFPRFVEAHAAEWKRNGKRVAMYCTGGIRCEKTSGWMQQELGLQVLELEGGILHYFQAMPDAWRDWEGECFVFDNRIALDTRLQETATTAEQVYADQPDGAWRLQRARRLDAAQP
ncbi:rhodanese-like domain-containing protein [Eleftheria terrae]|uniref:oxygen-dependent tRNA uridine(34) hydroxylase TrhO n=1 Tax=Eleftheria terrae TaxID=1597781 RepID=UPI00263B3A7B|nr:rhodanese-like domain-containing protein [Eleftheria terrae]WKB53111.1 rhodanese-like domain-containing protein [Eleftheria terrae]